MILRAMIYCVLVFFTLCSFVGYERLEGPEASILDTDAIEFHPDQFFVYYDENVNEDSIQAYLTDLNSTELWRSGHLNLAFWEVDSFPFTTSSGEIILDIQAAIARSKKKTQIRDATFNILRQLDTLDQASGSSCFQLSDYFYTHGTENIIISILDTGLDNIQDNDTSGGFNYNLTTYTGYDYVNNDPIPDDENGHGTHVTGLIHSITHQSNPVNSKISFDIRKTHNADGQAYMSAVVFALIDAIDEGADIVNMSFGFTDFYHDSLFFPLELVMRDAVEYEDVLIVVAAGNDSQDNDILTNTALPASFPIEGTISVASLDCANQLSMFSNYGATTVDVAVLGERIPGPDLGTGRIELSGTSQATAIVSALAALKATHFMYFEPKLFTCPIISTAIHEVSLTDKMMSSGRLNVSDFLVIADTSCYINQFDCNTSFTHANQLTGLVQDNNMIETDSSLASSQVLESGTINTYDAASSITLMPGFESKSGALFQVKADGCEH